MRRRRSLPALKEARRRRHGEGWGRGPGCSLRRSWRSLRSRPPPFRRPRPHWRVQSCSPSTGRCSTSGVMPKGSETGAGEEGKEGAEEEKEGGS